MTSSTEPRTPRRPAADRHARSVRAPRLVPALERASARAEAPIRTIVRSHRLNPLPHAGTISVFLLGVVIVTGVYITLFFQFGFEASHRSVQRMSDHPIQSVVRTIHRYSSAALVLTTVVHAWRVFVAGRFRGPRRWRWTSGVAVPAGRVAGRCHRLLAGVGRAGAGAQRGDDVGRRRARRGRHVLRARRVRLGRRDRLARAVRDLVGAPAAHGRDRLRDLEARASDPPARAAAAALDGGDVRRPADRVDRVPRRPARASRPRPGRRRSAARPVRAVPAASVVGWVGVARGGRRPDRVDRRARGAARATHRRRPWSRSTSTPAPVASCASPTARSRPSRCTTAWTSTPPTARRRGDRSPWSTPTDASVAASASDRVRSGRWRSPGSSRPSRSIRPVVTS